MAYYGNSFYSLAKYGAGTLVDFDATPMVATSSDYGQITVTWASPTGAWDLLHLVRNTFGFPMTPDDGDLLTEQAIVGNQPSYVDKGLIPNNAGLIPGQVYYYSVFVRKVSDQKWYKAGNAIGISVKNYDTANLMYDYLPQIYKTLDTSSYFDTSSVTNSDLYNFIRVFAFEHDLLKTMASNVNSRYNFFETDGRLLVPILNQLGITYEKEIGIQQARTLAKNAAAIYTKKGSAAGLKNFITAYSGYSASLLPVKNLMLDVNASSFETSIGGWEANSNTTISQITGLSESPVVTPYAEPTSPSNFPNSQKGMLKVVATAAGTVDFYCGLSAPKTNGIPVKAGLAYSFSVYGRNKTTGTHTVTLNVNWYDMTGTLISTSSNGTGSITATGWARVSLANITAPANAYFAVPHISTATMGAGEVIYFDAAQFEQSATVTNFVDARRIDILLNANRVNLVTNPNFETDVSRWACTGTLSRTTSSFYFGTASAQVVCTAQSQIVYIDYTNSSSATASTIYTSSAYVLAELGKPFSIELRSYDSSGNYLGAATQGAIGTGAWQRVSLTATSASSATKIGVGIRNNFAGAHTFYVDGVLVEQSSTVNPYFDGSNGYYQSGDLLWENGTPNAGRSFYYKNYQIIFKRLLAITGDYVPFGAPWALFVAQTP